MVGSITLFQMLKQADTCWFNPCKSSFFIGDLLLWGCVFAICLISLCIQSLVGFSPFNLVGVLGIYPDHYCPINGQERHME